MVSTHTPRLAVIVPVLNDAAALANLLDELAGGAAPLEIVVVDGGSSDDSAAVAERAGVRVLQTPAGRGRQLAAGVAASQAAWVWLLHADSRGVSGPRDYLLGLATTQAGRAPAWGRFDVTFDEPAAAFAVIAKLMNVRSRVTGICTGDQGVFVHRELLEAAGGVPEQPLMEDIELSRRLKRLMPPLAASERLVTTARRWRRRGLIRTVVSMWGFRLRYALGADPERLARQYYR